MTRKKYIRLNLFHPRNEELIDELSNVSKNYVEVLSSYWADMGLTDHMIEDRKATIIKVRIARPTVILFGKKVFWTKLGLSLRTWKK